MTVASGSFFSGDVARLLESLNMVATAQCRNADELRGFVLALRSVAVATGADVTLPSVEAPLTIAERRMAAWLLYSRLSDEQERLSDVHRLRS